MKLPRWLVIGLLGSSVLAVLVAPCWLWAKCPERTAREFVALMAEAKLDEAKNMIGVGPEGVPHVVADDNTRWAWDQSTLQIDARSMSDILDARQHFRLPRAHHAFTVHRGKIVEQEFLDDSDRLVFTLPQRQSPR
jgi:hypothetical protein